MYSKAQVVSQAPPNGVYVTLPSGQVPGAPIIVGSHGPVDALRIKKSPLPTPGTWGLVVFPAGDIRNGVWVCSLPAQQQIAYTSTTDPHEDYHSHYSGYYELLDQNGNKNTYFPDGTSVVVSSTGALATTFRQTVPPSQIPELTEFTPAQRIPSPPSPFFYTINHASGASVSIAPDGTITINAANGKKIDLVDGNAGATDSLALVSKLVAWLETHTHTSESPGTPTSPPIQSITATTIESQVVAVNA